MMIPLILGVVVMVLVAEWVECRQTGLVGIDGVC